MFFFTALQLKYVGFIIRWFQISQVKENVHSWKLKGWDIYWRAKLNAGLKCIGMFIIHEKGLKK